MEAVGQYARSGTAGRVRLGSKGLLVAQTDFVFPLFCRQPNSTSRRCGFLWTEHTGRFCLPLSLYIAWLNRCTCRQVDMFAIAEMDLSEDGPAYKHLVSD